MAEWSKASHSKCDILARVSGVRILLPPPKLKIGIGSRKPARTEQHVRTGLFCYSRATMWINDIYLLTYDKCLLDLCYMKQGSTLFLKSVIYLFGLAVLGVCVIIVGVSVSGNAGMFLPMMLVMLITAVPFFYALYQGLLLLGYIDNNTAFSDLSVKAIQNIKQCAFTISVLYAAGMPYIIYVADKDDAPGAVMMGLVFIIAPLIICVFAAVLQKLLQNAIAIKSENDLTV